MGILDAPTPSRSETAVSNLALPGLFALDDWVDRAFLPPAAADTPTITYSSTTTTALTTPKVFKPANVGKGSRLPDWDGQNDPNFRFGSGWYTTSNGANSDLGLVGQLKPFGVSQASRWPVVMSFDTSSDVVEIFSYAGNNESMMFRINDKWLTEGVQDRSSVTTNGILTTLTFPSAKVRKITIVAPGAPGISEVRVKSTAGLWKPKAVPKRRIAIIGDSFVGGAGTWAAGGALQTETWAFRLMHLMGADDPINAGIGATGWLAGVDSGSGGVSNRYATRLDTVLAFNPHAIIFYGSVNDAQSGTGIQTEVETLLDRCAAVPEVYTIGAFTSGWENHNAAVKAGTLTRRRRYIDMTAFIFGTGKTGAMTGDGNADYYRLSDGTHPTTEAHRILAKRVFQSMSNRYGLS